MDDSNLPLNQRIPPTSLASPHELRPRDPGNIRWYRPGLAQTLQLMGWRIVYFLPAVLLVLCLLTLPWRIELLQIFIVWWKLVIIAVAVPAGYAIRTASNIVRARKEPFCIHCGYDLSGLPDNHICPECGEQYSFRLCDEYKRDPQWFIKRYTSPDLHPPAQVPFQAGISKRKRSRDGT